MGGQHPESWPINLEFENSRLTLDYMKFQRMINSQENNTQAGKV